MSRVSAAVAVVTIVLLATLTPATAGFTLTLNNAIDVPDHQVTIENDTFTVSTISQFTQGDSITVNTNGPADDAYRVYIYGVDDGSRTLVDTTYVPGDGDGTTTFDTTGYSPGSYVTTIYHDGTFYDPHPFVIAGYDLSLSLNDYNPEPGDTVAVTVTATPTASSGNPASMEVVVTKDDRATRYTATRTADGYTATISFDEAGAYRVYAVAHSTEEAPGGEPEVIALTEPMRLSVTTQTTTDTPPADGGHSTTTPTTTTAESTTHTTTTTTTTGSTPTTTTTHSTSQSTNTTHTTTAGPESTTTRTTTEASGTLADVVTPNPPTETTSGATPNTAPWLVGALLVLCLAVVRLRARR